MARAAFGELFGWNALRNCSRPRTGGPVQNVTLQAAIQRRPNPFIIHPRFNGRCSFWVGFLRHVGQPGWGPFGRFSFWVGFLRHVGQPGWGPFSLHWVGVSNVLFLWVSVAGFNFIPIHLVLLQIRSLIPTIGPPLNPFHPSINLHLQRFHGIYSGYNTFLNHPVGNG